MQRRDFKEDTSLPGKVQLAMYGSLLVGLVIGVVVIGLTALLLVSGAFLFVFAFAPGRAMSRKAPKIDGLLVSRAAQLARSIESAPDVI